MKKFSILLTVVALFLFGACNNTKNDKSTNGDKTSEATKTEVVENNQSEQNAETEAVGNADIQKYLEENNISVEPTESGLYYVVIEEGKGEQAKAGNMVKVHYTGTLLNGTKFDSSVDRGQPFEFKLGAGQVIKGWDEGIALMKVGEKGKLIIPSELAYGDRAMGDAIPANSPLVFEVELIEVK